MQIIYVKWRDAYLHEGWHGQVAIDRIKGTSVWVVDSLGWLIDQNEDRIIISQSVSNNGSCSEILAIPVEAVVEWQLLAAPDPNVDCQTVEGVIPFDSRLPTLQMDRIFVGNG